jgi:hypothetical protein
MPLPPLPAARAVSPQNNHVFGIEELAEMSSINFEWQPVQGANRYIFNLYVRSSSGSLTRIVENQSQSGTSYTYRNLTGIIDNGSSFVWRVEAQSRRNDGTIERRGNSAEFTFMINLPEVDTIETKDPGILYGN